MITKGVNALIFTDCSSQGGSVWGRSAGAYRIATELRKIGMTVQVVDFFNHIMMEDEGLMDHILQKFVGTSTMFVGFSTTFLNGGMYSIRKHPWMFEHKSSEEQHGFNRKFHYANSIYGPPADVMLALRKKIKMLNPKVDIIAAGTRVHDDDIIGDLNIIGYGETQLLDYIKWKNGKHPFFRWRAHMREGKYPKKIIEHDVKADGFDFIHSTIEWHDSDCIQPGEALPIEVSRGCIFRCKFCSFPLNGKAKMDYLKDKDLLRQEMLSNYERFGTTRYVFSDDTYNDTTEKLEYMNEIVRTLPFKPEFATYVRLDLLTSKPEQADLMLENGIKVAFFGIESLNYESAKSIGKGMKTEKQIETLYWLREDKWKHDVATVSGFIYGLPHDTYKTMEDWTERIMDPRFPLHAFNLSPLGIANLKLVKRSFTSEIEQDPAKFGYVLDDKILEHWTNEKYGTTFAGCNDLANKTHAYAKSLGRLCISSHIMISTIGLGIGYQQHLEQGINGVYNSFSLFNRTRVLFLSYLSDLLKVETE